MKQTKEKHTDGDPNTYADLFPNRSGKLTKTQIKGIIHSNLTLGVAKEWQESSEKLLEFDYGFNTQHLGLSCTDDADLFDYALNIFEACCEQMLKLTRSEFLIRAAKAKRKGGR